MFLEGLSSFRIDVASSPVVIQNDKRASRALNVAFDELYLDEPIFFSVFSPKRFLSWGVKTLFVGASARKFSSARLCWRLLVPPGGWMWAPSSADLCHSTHSFRKSPTSSGSDFPYTKNSARPRSHFIYTQNSARPRSDFIYTDLWLCRIIDFAWWRC